MKQSLIALSMALLSTTTVVHAEDRALLVGVGIYAEPAANLPGIEKDIDMMQQLVAHMGIDSKNTQILSDQAATQDAFRTALKKLATTTQADDRVVIYVSSHGSNTKDTNGDEDDSLDETLYLHDGHFLDDEFGDLLKQIPSQNIVVLIDACHSGTGTKSINANALTGATQTRTKAWNLLPRSKSAKTSKDFEAVAATESTDGAAENYLAIGAAQDDQESDATSEGSLFTKALLNSFESARGKNESTSWSSLYDATKQQLASMNARFSPNLSGSTTLASKTIRFAANIENENPLWKDTLNAVKGSATQLEIETPDRLKEGELLTIKIDVPSKGYLNVINIGPTDNATLLFPNKFDKNNQVDVQTFSLPSAGKFKLPAQAPFGKNLIAVFLTAEPIDLQQKALGNRDSKGQINTLFGRLPLSTIRALGRSKSTGGSYAAGYRIVNVTEK